MTCLSQNRPKVPLELALKYSSYVGASPFAVAKDPLVLYSVTTDVSGGAPSPLSAFSVPDPATLDPYGLATVQALKGAWLYALGRKLPNTTPDAIGSWTQVEYGGSAYGFTGKSQICTNVTGSLEEYEAGSSHTSGSTALTIPSAVPQESSSCPCFIAPEPAATQR